MPVRLLIVDDSAFIRATLRAMLEVRDRIEIVGTAQNGREAVEQAIALKPDVITMDVEMPVMDGVSAAREIMLKQPTPILMFSTLTEAGAQATLDALDAGAVDFLPKRFQDLAQDRAQVERLLRDKVLQVASAKARTALKAMQLGSKVGSDYTLKRPSRPMAAQIAKKNRQPPFKLLAVGTSTGGPKALQEIIAALPRNFPLPIVLIQHMPASFTCTFAQRLDQLSPLKVKEAEDGDRLRRGTAYLAPGGKQMRFERRGDEVAIHIEEAGKDQIYKPCVDFTFQSAAQIFGPGVLAVVLTGMGADGREGARTLVGRGSSVWTQNEESCVIYGMPKAVVDAGLSEKSFALPDLPALLSEEV